MSVPVRQQALIWGGVLFVLAALLWGLGNVILPFIMGGAVAYFLDPLADRFEAWGMSRSTATAVISIIALVIFILLALLIVPMIVRQAIQLVNSAPSILGQLQTFLAEHFPQALDSEGVLRETLASIGKTIQAKGGELVSGVLSSAISVINWLLFLVVVPVVAFYLLLDWDHMVEQIDVLLPRDYRDQIREIARDIDRVLAGFVRGQVSVCLILGTFYSVALILAGLQFGLVVGAIAGLITFIPYVGALTGGSLAIGLALVQFWGDWLHIGLIAAIFAMGQFIEGNILTPRLVGKSVGLHPVWLLFALAVMGALFGFVGMLTAVPIAASVGVLARFAIKKYLGSALYWGHTRRDSG